MKENIKITELSDGTILKKLDGKYHCIGGPAIKWPGKFGKEFFHLYGVHYSKSDYAQELVNRGLMTENERFVFML